LHIYKVIVIRQVKHVICTLVEMSAHKFANTAANVFNCFSQTVKLNRV